MWNVLVCKGRQVAGEGIRKWPALYMPGEEGFSLAVAVFGCCQASSDALLGAPPNSRLCMRGANVTVSAVFRMPRVQK